MGFYKALFHVPLFVELQQVVRRFLFCIIPAYQQYFAKEKGIAKNIIQTLRAIMIFQHIDLVAGDFNGTTWRCRSRDNLCTIDEVFSDCALLTPPGPAPL